MPPLPFSPRRASLAAHLQALAYACHAEVMAQKVVQQGVQQAVVEQQPMEALPQKHLAHNRLQQRLGLRSREAFRAAQDTLIDTYTLLLGCATWDSEGFFLREGPLRLRQRQPG